MRKCKQKDCKKTIPASKRSHAVYCSKACRNKKYVRNPVAVSCNYCGKTVTGRSDVRFCSKKCNVRFNKKDILHDCSVCSNLYKKKGNTTTCSKQCSLDKRREAHKKRSSRHYYSSRRFNIADRLRTRIYGAMKGKVKKSESTQQLIGCTFEKARSHIESLFVDGMSWSNYGEWHIDHIKPISSFNLEKKSERIKCFNYKNLQPLWALENLRKGNKLNVSRKCNYPC